MIFSCTFLMRYHSRQVVLFSLHSLSRIFPFQTYDAMAYHVSQPHMNRQRMKAVILWSLQRTARGSVCEWADAGWVVRSHSPHSRCIFHSYPRLSVTLAANTSRRRRRKEAKVNICREVLVTPTANTSRRRRRVIGDQHFGN